MQRRVNSQVKTPQLNIAPVSRTGTAITRSYTTRSSTISIASRQSSRLGQASSVQSSTALSRALSPLFSGYRKQIASQRRFTSSTASPKTSPENDVATSDPSTDASKDVNQDTSAKKVTKNIVDDEPIVKSRSGTETKVKDDDEEDLYQNAEDSSLESSFRNTHEEQTFRPNEPYFAENGDECLVFYEADEESVARVKRERFQSLMNASLVAPVCSAIAYGFIPSPYSFAIYAISAIVFVRNFIQVVGLSAFVTKITAVWPSERSDVSSDLLRNLDEMVESIETIPATNTEETEFEQRTKHNNEILNGEEQDEPTGKPKKDTTQSAQARVYGQPGVDPMGNSFVFNPNAPDGLTFKFGFTEAQTNTKIPDRLLFQRADLVETTKQWNAMGDPDFPEYIYVDRLNNGKTPLYQKIPLNKCAAFLATPTVPPQIPLLDPKTVEVAQKYPHDRMVFMLRAENTVTGLYPRFIKNVDAYNQFAFAMYLNARNEVKDRFNAARGKMKL